METPKAEFIGYARDALKVLKEAAINGGEGDPRTLVNRIEKRLDSAGVGFEALDKEGKKSADDMRKEVKQYASKLYIRDAQEEYKKLNAGDGSVVRIEDNLKAAGVGFEALDKEGKKSASDMRKEVHIRAAKNSFEDLKSGNGSVEIIKDHLKEAGVGFEALDKEGKKSADDMRKEVKQYASKLYIRDAQETLKTLGSDPNPDHRSASAALAEDFLRKAGVPDDKIKAAIKYYENPNPENSSIPHKPINTGRGAGR